MGFLKKGDAPSLANQVKAITATPVTQVPDKPSTPVIKKSLLGAPLAKQTSPAVSVTSPSAKGLTPVAPSASAVNESAPSPQLTQQTSEPKGLLARAVLKGQEKADKAEEDVNFLFREEPTDFKAVLTRFDELLHRDNGLADTRNIDDFNIDTCRNYIKRIYTELQTQPELEGLMVDRDVANVIFFIRSIRERAEETGVVKANKAKAKKLETRKKDRFGDAGLTLDLNSLEDLSNVDSDEWKM